MKGRIDLVWFIANGSFLFLASVFFLGFNEEVVLGACTIFFLSFVFFSLKNQIFFFFLEKKLESEKNYFYLFFLRLSKLKLFYEVVLYLRLAFFFFSSFFFFFYHQVQKLVELSFYFQKGFQQTYQVGLNVV